jgi:hypothetical protein
MDMCLGVWELFNHVTFLFLLATPFIPVLPRDLVADARVLSSIMTLTLWALSYTGGLYAENAFL